MHPSNPPKKQNDKPLPAMEHLLKSITGLWLKQTKDPCSKNYPDKLAFLKDGIYKSTSAHDHFSLWQSGDFELVDQEHIKIQDARDAMVSYPFKIDQQKLSIVLSDTCVLVYQKKE